MLLGLIDETMSLFTPRRGAIRAAMERGFRVPMDGIDRFRRRPVGGGDSWRHPWLYAPFDLELAEEVSAWSSSLPMWAYSDRRAEVMEALHWLALDAGAFRRALRRVDLTPDVISHAEIALDRPQIQEVASQVIRELHSGALYGVNSPQWLRATCTILEVIEILLDRSDPNHPVPLAAEMTPVARRLADLVADQLIAGWTAATSPARPPATMIADIRGVADAARQGLASPSEQSRPGLGDL